MQNAWIAVSAADSAIVPLYLCSPLNKTYTEKKKYIGEIAEVQRERNNF